MFRQQFTGFLHPVDDTGRKFGFAEISGHRGGELPPKLIAALGVDGFVADDGKFVRTRGYENQHIVPVRRLVQTQPQKFPLRGSHRIVHVSGADHDPDFAGGLMFGIPNRRDHAVVVQVFGKGFRVHITSSLLRHRPQSCRRRPKTHPRPRC